MAAELWDLSAVQERIAAAMWQAELGCSAPTVSRARTPEAFKEEDPRTREKWLELAAVALEALFDKTDAAPKVEGTQ